MSDNQTTVTSRDEQTAQPTADDALLCEMPCSFRQWLEGEIAYLESIKRTKFGDGGLANLRAALKELEFHGW